MKSKGRLGSLTVDRATRKRSWKINSVSISSVETFLSLNAMELTNLDIGLQVCEKLGSTSHLLCGGSLKCNINRSADEPH